MISISEFANRAGVSRQAVYKAIKSGKLPPASNGKLDENNNLCVEYLSGSNPSVPRQVTASSSRSVVQQSATGRAAVDLEKAKQQAIHWQLRNQKERGSLIDRELVAKSIEITDSEHKKLLADGAQTIAKTVHDLVKTGATREDVVEAIRSELSGALKSWKRQITRTLKLFYDEQDTGR
jgi:hypothetical protein